MRVKIFRNSSAGLFREQVFYVMSKADMSVPLCSRRVITASEEMAAVSYGIRSLANRNMDIPGLHMVIQFTEEEYKGSGIEKKRDIILEFIRRMGWDSCQYMAVLHKDVDGNPHVHVLVNVIRDDGSKTEDQYTIKNAQRIIGSLTGEFFSRRNVPENDSGTVMALVQHAMDESATMREMRRNLGMEMISVRLNEDGSMDFGWLGEKKRYRYKDLNAEAVSRMIHGETVLRKLEKEKEERRRAHVITGSGR